MASICIDSQLGHEQLLTGLIGVVAEFASQLLRLLCLDSDEEWQPAPEW